MAGFTELRGHTTVFIDLRKVKAVVLIQEHQMTGKMTDYCNRLKSMTSVTYSTDETGSVCNLVKVYHGDCCCGGTKLKQWVTVLLACNAEGSDKTTPLQKFMLL
jgi:hypothetical protein